MKHEKKQLTHFDGMGNAIMVDVGGKEITVRHAIAKGNITVNEHTLKAIKSGTAKKGDVLGIARIAGIMAAKKTSEIIPLCHPLIFEKCTVDFEIPDDDCAEKCRLKSSNSQNKNYKIEATCTVRLSGKTGAEMEALTGVSAALLTIYDMCKAIERGMVIGDVCLEEKSGGKSGGYKRPKLAN
ncbi:MAG: cyclic pyranopterin monophosphate synthase MoaC [Termitinemataceae bacterium]|nr:MAG: cyclic pyranopterin monophosphate synthase MoaC [Termitinemataceae bacterium]